MVWRNRLLAVLFAVLLVGLAAAEQPGITIQTGLSSGVLLVPNPGDAYGTPVLTELAVELVVPTSIPLTIGTGLGIAPFLPIDEAFGRSLLTVAEAAVGLRLNLLVLDDGALYTEAALGGGLYTRVTEGERAGGTARRPTASVRTMGGMTTGRWEYQIGVVTRILFDQQPVVAVSPQLGFRYRFRIGGLDESSR